MTVLDVSVVIPCFNGADTLWRCLESVSNQLALPCEIIIVDDGSDSPLQPLIASWQNDLKVPVSVIRQLNNGAPNARNAGIQAAKGKYIAFLDADDVWFPEKLKIQHKIMDSQGFSILGHGYSFEGKGLPENNSDAGADLTSPKMISKWHFVCGNPFFTPTVMVLKNKFTGFDERFRRIDDYKAWFENCEQGRCARIDLVLAKGFKAPIGCSGLTASVEKMHESYLEVLAALLQEQKINYLFYVFARIIEALKYPIRRNRIGAKASH